jgi:CBS domain containing-hemolysin-like protein
MGFSGWIHVLWLAELALEPVLVLVLLSRKAWRKFPLFTAYCMWTLVGDVAAYLASQHLGTYVYVYLVNETVSLILALALIYEIFSQLFAGHLALRNLASRAFRWVCVALLFLGAVVLVTHAPIGSKGAALAVLVVEETYRILEVGLIVFLFVFSGAFGLHWRQHIFGVVLGLGISAAVKLVAVTVGAIGPQSYAMVGTLNVAMMLSYNLSFLIWIGYWLTPERVTIAAALPKRAQLEQWNQAVMELIHQ